MATPTRTRTLPRRSTIPTIPPRGSRDLTDDEGFGDPPGYMTWSDDGDGVFEQGECPDVDDAGYDYNQPVCCHRCRLTARPR